ncbi:MAG: hypothetical protein Q9195_001767 [Heterodermia aff. obscurata]
MSDNIDMNKFPVIYGYGHVDRKHCFFDDTQSTQEPYLAWEDYESNKVLEHCPVCNAVRWYILVPNEFYQETSMFPGDESSGSNTLSTLLAYTNDLTLLSGHIPSAQDRARGFHLACRYLDLLLPPILGCIPDIDGYELAPLLGQPEDAAGRQLMVHARVLNDFTNLPACTVFRPHAPCEPCVTELVLPGAYERLPPVVVAKPKSPVVGHRRNESEDSAIGLVGEVDMEMDMDME